MKRICRKCHKPSQSRLCRVCYRIQGHHDRTEESRVAELRKSGWVPPEVQPIRNNYAETKR